MVGDFNLVISPEKNYFSYLHLNNPKARDKVLAIMIEFDLIDCWREEHIDEKTFTWLKKNPLKQARLDFFLISCLLFSKVKDRDILAGYRTDHSVIKQT